MFRMTVWSALLMALFLSVTAEAQVRRGAPVFTGRTRIQSIPPVVSPVPPVPPRFAPEPVVRNQPVMRQGVVGRPGFAGNRANFRSGFGNAGFGFGVSPVVVSPYPGYFPYGYYPYTSPYPYPVNPAPYYPDTTPVPDTSYYATGEQSMSDLNNQIQRLTLEVQRLQELAATTSATAVPPPEAKPAPPPTPQPPTILIFKDGRRLESRGYAIVSKTLWAFTSTGTRSFPYDELDVDGTRAENLKHGIKFKTP
jgi:hypothetical protein